MVMGLYWLSRRRLKHFIKPLFFVSFIFIVYQAIFFLVISSKKNQIQGTHYYMRALYSPDKEGKFTCITSLEKIDFNMVNDDYCDCLDGSDEPGSNACPNGQFFCQNQSDTPNFKKIIPSSRVNDGICDCCDGSDEWLHRRLSFAFGKSKQEALGRYFSPCPHLCL